MPLPYLNLISGQLMRILIILTVLTGRLHVLFTLSNLLLLPGPNRSALART